MTDEFADQRLPDLPNAGYATAREKLITDAVMFFLRDIERDRPRLLTIVLGGKPRWLKTARELVPLSGASFRDEILGEMFEYLTLLAAPPVYQRQLLDARQNPAVKRDIVRTMTPHLEAQLAAFRERALMQKWAP